MIPTMRILKHRLLDAWYQVVFCVACGCALFLDRILLPSPKREPDVRSRMCLTGFFGSWVYEYTVNIRPENGFPSWRPYGTGAGRECHVCIALLSYFEACTGWLDGLPSLINFTGVIYGNSSAPSIGPTVPAWYAPGNNTGTMYSGNRHYSARCQKGSKTNFDFFVLFCFVFFYFDGNICLFICFLL